MDRPVEERSKPEAAPRGMSVKRATLSVAGAWPRGTFSDVAGGRFRFAARRDGFGSTFSDDPAFTPGEGQAADFGAEGRHLSGPWLLDAAGATSDDPETFTAGGTILPMGGLDHGHKGYGLSLLIESITQGLARTALRREAEAAREGLTLYSGITEVLRTLAERVNTPMPTPI